MQLRATVPWDVDEHCWTDMVDGPTQRQYSAYARPLGIGPRPALLLIDLYNLVFAGGAQPPTELCERYPSTCGQYAHAALPGITRLLEAARSTGTPVLHVTVGDRPGISATNRTGGPEALDDYAFHPQCAPVEGEPVVRKDRASAFYGTSLVAQLVRRGIDTLIVAGETTSGCVRASVVDGYSNGFHMVMAEDAVFDRSWMSHCVNLFDLHHKYADVMKSDTILGLLTTEADGRDSARERTPARA